MTHAEAKLMLVSEALRGMIKMAKVEVDNGSEVWKKAVDYAEIVLNCDPFTPLPKPKE